MNSAKSQERLTAQASVRPSVRRPTDHPLTAATTKVTTRQWFLFFPSVFPLRVPAVPSRNTLPILSTNPFRLLIHSVFPCSLLVPSFALLLKTSAPGSRYFFSAASLPPQPLLIGNRNNGRPTELASEQPANRPTEQEESNPLSPPIFSTRRNAKPHQSFGGSLQFSVDEHVLLAGVRRVRLADACTYMRPPL